MSETRDDSLQNVDTEVSQPSSSKYSNELAAAVNALTLETDALPPIFKLYLFKDCWEEILDWLSIHEIHSFGQTCTKFYQLAGEYFRWKYRRVLAHVYDASLTIDWSELQGFNEFAQRLSFYSSEPEESLRYALKNCKSAKEMEIVNARTNEFDVKPLESLLSKIEIMRISNVYLSAEFFDQLLKPCIKLKRLSFDRSPRNGWMHWTFPKLEHLELFECDPVEDNDLITFFEQNPNVRSFSTSAELLLRIKDLFMATNIELNDLKISIIDDIDQNVANALIELHHRGFYKKLHIQIGSKKHLEQLPGLTTLHVITYNYIKLPPLPTVKALVFQSLWNGLCSWMDMDEVAQALSNLECISTEETNDEYMQPFIRKSLKLKEIRMEYLRGDIDILAMNNDRKKLEKASKVTIYLEERDYLRLKWKYGKSEFGLIELKRKESYDGAYPSPYSR